jgi:hypothetical protein
MVQQVTDMCQPSGEEEQSLFKKCAFLSTPSIYFSLKDKSVKEVAKVFDVSDPYKLLNSHLDRHKVREGPKLCVL